MLRAYADTSALFAIYHPKDEFSLMVDKAVREVSPSFAYWTLLRFELRHTLRQCRGNVHGETAWSALRAAEGARNRLRWHFDLRADDLIELAEDLSASHGRDLACGAMDVVHVAAATRLFNRGEIDEFWTCDRGQAELARKGGLSIRHFKLPPPPGEPAA